jgi:DNA-binding transcriptional MerR regulator
MMQPMTEFSMPELAERSGVNAQRLRQLVDLGILSPDAAGRFQPADIQRVRIIEALERAGIAPAQIGQLIAAGAYSLDWAQVLFPDPTPQVATTLQAAAAELGFPPSLVAGLYAAWELARPEPEQPLRADDAELLRLAVLGYSAFGHDETVTLGIARQLGEMWTHIQQYPRHPPSLDAMARRSGHAQAKPTVTSDLSGQERKRLVAL